MKLLKVFYLDIDLSIIRGGAKISDAVAFCSDDVTRFGSDVG